MYRLVIPSEGTAAGDESVIVGTEVPVVVDEDPKIVSPDAGVVVLTLTAVTLAADACNCSLRAVATRSFRRTLLLTPLCSLWTQAVNWALVGSVPMIDSNRLVTM